MQFTSDMYNCGLQLLAGLQNAYPEKVLETVPNTGLVMFSDNINSVGGINLAKFLFENDFGPIVASPQATNPVHNHETTIQAWVWAVDFKKVTAWRKEREKEALAKALEEKAKVATQMEARGIKPPVPVMRPEEFAGQARAKFDPPKRIFRRRAV